MVYLSQLLGKPVYFHNKPFGKILDMAIFENSPHAPISKIEIRHGKKKLTISPHALAIENNHFYLKTQQIPFLPYDHKDFYLAEDLLDKQVIDIDGHRLVRVNDVLLEVDTELKVTGIDVGFKGVLRRLGLGILPFATKIIPWKFIEAFDYHTGNIQIKLTQGKLNTMHPSEIADILEDVGTKERLGIVAALDARKAARAIEETNNQTQISILEESPVSGIHEVLNKMHVAELVDVLRHLNPLKRQEIQNVLGAEKTQRVKHLLKFPDNTAGGLMHPVFFHVNAAKTVKEVALEIREKRVSFGTIIIVNNDEKLIGTVRTRDLLIIDPLAIMKDIIRDKQFAYPDMDILEVFKLFTKYDLRTLPVVDKNKKPIGVILIDDLLKTIEQEQEKDETL